MTWRGSLEAQSKARVRGSEQGKHEAESCQLPSCGLLDQRKDAADLKRKVGGFPNVNWRRERLIWGCLSPASGRGKNGSGCEQIVQREGRAAKLHIFMQFSNV